MNEVPSSPQLKKGIKSDNGNEEVVAPATNARDIGIFVDSWRKRAEEK